MVSVKRWRREKRWGGWCEKEKKTVDRQDVSTRNVVYECHSAFLTVEAIRTSSGKPKMSWHMPCPWTCAYFSLFIHHHFSVLSPVCALEGLLFCDVISLTHICVPLLRPMTVILGLTHPSSLIHDMTSSSLVLSCLWFVLSYLALDPPYSSPFSETRWTLYLLWFVDSYLWLVLMTHPFDSDSSWPLTHMARPRVYKE